MNTLQNPQTAEDHAEVEYGKDLIKTLVGGTVIGFGANEKGEIFLATMKDDKRVAVVIGKDERGDIAVFELTEAGHDEG